ncbi:protein of unknown function [Paenibacillus alvei]|uniref:Uncharacterized protein n=1 Tax=Paenibacillus alvei TaxID=44250 RepID=A0A383RE85_PAEAL|nr:protein of unknown function [Paenibacillus alvei]
MQRCCFAYDVHIVRYAKQQRFLYWSNSISMAIMVHITSIVEVTYVIYF